MTGLFPGSPFRNQQCVPARRLFGWSPLPLIALILLTCPISSAAQSAEFQSLSIGFDSVGRVGSWLPVRAAVTGIPDGETVELHVATADPRGDQIVEVAASAVAGSDGTAFLNGFVRFGRLIGVANVAIVSAADPTVRYCRTAVSHGDQVDPSTDAQARKTSLKLWRYDVPFLLTVGDPAGIAEVERNSEAVSETQPPLVILRVATAAQLPSSSLGYDSIDHVLLTDDFTLNDPQFQALKLWVLSGGHWLVASGKTVSSLLESKPGQWLKSRFEITGEPVPIRILSTLETFVSGASRVPAFYDSVPMAVVHTEQARVLVRTLDGPLISRLGAGAGIVTFVSVELNARPLNAWRSLPQLYETLILGKTITHAGRTDSGSARISSSGVSDLATQLMATVDAQPENGRWSTWSVMAIIFGYLLLIGPLDYLLVVVLLKRPHLTWITFPLLVVAGVWALASMKAASSENVTQLNQLHVMDVLQDNDEQRLLVRSWMSLSSPDTRRSDLSARPERVQPLLKPKTLESSLSWAGRPEDVYGGLYREGGIPLARQQYLHNIDMSADKIPLRGVPLLTDGSYEMLSTWTAEAAKPLISSQLAVSGLGMLQGSMSHNLPGDVADWIIIHGNRMYRPSGLDPDLYSLLPAEPLNLGREDIIASDLKAFLNGARIIENESRSSAASRAATQIITPYDPLRRDPKDILTMLSLYGSAGGQSYVGLSQHQLRRMELSDTIRLNYALLLGRYAEPVTQLLQDGKPVPVAESITLVRMLIPVDRRPARRQGLTDEELREQGLPDDGATNP